MSNPNNTLAYSNVSANTLVRSGIIRGVKNDSAIFARSLDGLLAPGGAYEGKFRDRTAIADSLLNCSWEPGPRNISSRTYQHYKTDQFIVDGHPTKVAIIVSDEDAATSVALALFIPHARS
ncbi:hypothetical protein IJ117_02460 [Candidatus Saccharibacteria bacterium]|nr:hypothetical protein [Candidatus Saccharibacteria bacterium]